ncbi:MAG: signal peptide peptidase SppA [Thermodesulfobacteriota bacterium]
MSKLHVILVATVTALLLAGCSPTLKLFPDARDPLEEYTLQGDGEEKILVIPVNGAITDSPKRKGLRSQPGTVRTVVSHLKKAEEDEDIKAVILKIDSPGGPVTAADMLYHELLDYKRRSGSKMVAAMMDLAASGGYYVALPADHIIAHPTSVTGSVGVVFVRPAVTGLMSKIGVDVNAYTTGKNKDMGSPFRDITSEEQAIIQSLIDDLGERFLKLVAQHRNMDAAALEKVATARVFLGPQAKELGLVDEIGYLSDAVDRAKSLAGLPENAQVVIYRRTEYPEDNIYNTAALDYDDGGYPSAYSMIQVALPDFLPAWNAGFQYLWYPGADIE